MPTKRHDFWFPQDDPATARLALGTDGAWMPVFVDYLYLSITNSVAFSPTDTLPLTSRAKLLMAAQSLAAMVTSLLVIARAVNVLPVNRRRPRPRCRARAGPSSVARWPR